MFDNRPIGVFDSGVGGLTVLQAIEELLPSESTIYLGDLARCPYGPRPQEEVGRFAHQVAWELGSYDIKMLVIACNTATAAAYEELRAQCPFPVIGVVEPGARRAARLSQSGVIGVIATDGTVSSGAYRRAIVRHSPDAIVLERSASWLVPLIEEGDVARSTVMVELTPTLIELHEQGIDTLILGCTHFPLVRDIFEAEVGSGVRVVDSAGTTAEEVANLLQERGLGAHGSPTRRFLVTGPAVAFAERARRMFGSSLPIESVSLDLASPARTLSSS